MKRKVALVLSGGGARGLAHIGVIEELERQGYNISAVAGTSMGAVVGGLYAAGRLEWYKAWMKSLDKIKVFKLVDITLSKSGLIRGDKVFRTMKKVIPDVPIEELHIPFCAVAVDILAQKEVLISKGSLYHAMRASISIPTIITPLKTKDQILIDGGVTNNIPVHAVKRSKNDLLVVVDVNAEIPYEQPKTILASEISAYKKRLTSYRKEVSKLSKTKTTNLSYFNLMAKTIDTMMNANTALMLKEHPPDLIIKVSRHACSLFDFYKADQMIEIGRLAAKKYLQKIK